MLTIFEGEKQVNGCAYEHFVVIKVTFLFCFLFYSIYLCCIAVIHIQRYTYTCGNIVNTIMTNEHSSLEKYISHTLFEMVAKGLCVRGELETEQTATYWPPVLPSLAALLSRSAGLLNLLSAGSHCLELQQTDSKLTELPVAPGYIIVWRPPASCECHICTQFSPSTVKVIPWYLRPDAPVPWSTAGSEVNMLHLFIYYFLSRTTPGISAILLLVNNKREWVLYTW